MDRLQLATLLSWAGVAGIQGRKRLQKVVFFLQQAGCPLGCQYTLHHFGPYSRDVADACDEMVAAGLIEEKEVGLQLGNTQYEYSLKPQTRELLARAPHAQLHNFQELGSKLIGDNLWTLELGSTILYFYAQSHDWADALTKACEFKKVPSDNASSVAALKLAKQVQAHPKE